MYEVHQREWNSRLKVAVIFKSEDLEECIVFKQKWEQVMDKLYKGIQVGDECCHFASVYNPEKDDYIKYLVGKDNRYHEL